MAKTKTKRKTKTTPPPVLTKPKGLSPRESKAWDAAVAQGSFGGGWAPSGPGDFIIGKLVGKRSEGTKYGPKTFLDVKPKDGTVISIACGTVLTKVLEEVKPKVGQTIMVLYRGEYDSGKGSPAKLFSLTIVE